MEKLLIKQKKKWTNKHKYYTYNTFLVLLWRASNCSPWWYNNNNISSWTLQFLRLSDVHWKWQKLSLHLSQHLTQSWDRRPEAFSCCFSRSSTATTSSSSRRSETATCRRPKNSWSKSTSQTQYKHTHTHTRHCHTKWSKNHENDATMTRVCVFFFQRFPEVRSHCQRASGSQHLHREIPLHLQVRGKKNSRAWAVFTLSCCCI